MENTNNYLTTENDLFTDLALTLYNDSDGDEITINVHKIILYKRCDYFKKLLTNCREKNSNKITIWVPNVYIARDIIMSFYNNKNNISDSDWNYVLEYIMCCDFFMLDFNRSLLENLEVPRKGFELLLTVVNTIDHNDEFIYLIKKNLPTNYILPDKLQHKIEEMDRQLQVSSPANNLKGWFAEANVDFKYTNQLFKKVTDRQSQESSLENKFEEWFSKKVPDFRYTDKLFKN